MKLRLILIIMFLSSLFSFAQKSKYEIIYPNARFYEFNTERDKIYILDFDNQLSVYNIGIKKLTPIEKDDSLEYSVSSSLFLTDDGLIYCVSETNIRVIKDDKIIKRIPVIHNKNLYTKQDKEKRSNELNKLVSDYNGDNIWNLFDKNIILNYHNGQSVAFPVKRVRYLDLSKENTAKIEKLQQKIDNIRDTSCTFKHTKNGTISTILKRTKYGTISTFLDTQIKIEGIPYSCRTKGWFMSAGPKKCRYKIKILHKNKSCTLKDRKRETSGFYWKHTWYEGDLGHLIPNSYYISDRNEEIFIIFTIKGYYQLVKIKER